MKRIVFIFAIVFCGSVQSQTYDTISGRDGKLPDYVYPKGWYDTCIVYYEGSLHITGVGGHTVSPYFTTTHPDFKAYEYRVDGPVAFTGVAVMILDIYRPEDSLWCPIINDTVIPDTVSIICRDSLSELNVMASVHTQWDTAARKVLKIPLSVDSLVDGFGYMYLYELKFNYPVVVDSLYYIFGTQWNKTYYNHFPYLDWLWHPYTHAVIHVDRYVQHYPGELYIPCDASSIIYRAYFDGGKFVMDTIPDYPRGIEDWWGPYLLMVDSCTIEVGSADSTMGTAGPTRGMSKWVTQTITATPEYGYRFSHWDDGNTENPRDIYLTQDTHFVAYFEPHPRHTLQTRCEPEGKGMVVGDGLYWYGDTATMTANALPPYIFHHWNDGNRDNPRRIAIEQDTSFTAHLARQVVSVDTVADAEALFTLTPNPAKERVTVTIGQGAEPPCTVVLRDEQGRELMRQRMEERTLTLSTRGLAAGVYLVTLESPRGNSTQRLVVER